MGRESGVKLAAIRSEQEQQRGELGKLRLEVPVNGSYTSIRNFILAVEKSAEPVYIASIENNPQEDEPGRLSLTLVLIAVYKKGKS
jgi:Tfp pilus assembly protein PilO